MRRPAKAPAITAAIPWAGPTGPTGPISACRCKVPDEIDIQRAREVLDELRRRLGDPSRPADRARLSRAPDQAVLIATRWDAANARTRHGLMLEPIVSFFTRIFQSIGARHRLAVGVVLRPFVWLGRWYRGAAGFSRPCSARCCSAHRLPLRLFLLDHAALDEFQSGLRQGLRSCGEERRGGTAQRSPQRRHRQRTGRDATASQPGAAQTCRRSAHRRRDRRSGRLQRQSERVDLLDDPLQARPVRHRLGPHAIFRQQGRVPARREPGDTPHVDRARRHAGTRARHLADRFQPAERTRQSAVRRVRRGISA